MDDVGVPRLASHPPIRPPTSAATTATTATPSHGRRGRGRQSFEASCPRWAGRRPRAARRSATPWRVAAPHGVVDGRVGGLRTDVGAPLLGSWCGVAPRPRVRRVGGAWRRLRRVAGSEASVPVNSLIAPPAPRSHPAGPHTCPLSIVGLVACSAARAHEVLTRRTKFCAVARRIEIELTSKLDDGRYTWRAAGAREPRGTLVADLVPCEREDRRGPARRGRVGSRRRRRAVDRAAQGALAARPAWRDDRADRAPGARGRRPGDARAEGSRPKPRRRPRRPRGSRAARSAGSEGPRALLAACRRATRRAVGSLGARRAPRRSPSCAR